MKVTFEEFEGCFSIDLGAENMEEAAKLVRFGMNRRNEVHSCHANITKGGGFSAEIVFGKSRRANSTVPKRP